MSRRIIAAAIVIGLVVVGLLWGPAACRSMQGMKKQAEVSREQGNASISAGAEAVNTVGNVSANAQATDDLVARGQADVRAAPDGEKGRAAVNAACRFKANRNKPECQGVTP
jgi:hypothetical protein